ncbi:hypothetical protein [Streptomyces sp. MI02-7b]|uniref:hypothetical protein n=1 Tax=Streptomyces sp. MI02-7b TaxID=462941 RepID=UPI0029BD58FB|nr:hypothetical protein [Streptomyces sp. MI02-7b]MDX3070981.1 hypothetical protein [Streptomyces sp. MI02-7b]
MTETGRPKTSAASRQVRLPLCERSTDVVFCCTAATGPVVRRARLAPGTHVSSVGGSHGPELDADTVREGTPFAERPAAASPPPAGAHELRHLPPGRPVVLLGSVLSGGHPGRGDSAGLTVLKSTGHAALDVAAADVVHAVARREGRGTTVDL